MVVWENQGAAASYVSLSLLNILAPQFFYRRKEANVICLVHFCLGHPVKSQVEG